MKTLKTPFISRKIEDSDKDVILFQIKEVLTDYRKALITRLILSLGTYIDYRFKIKPTRKQSEEITERLFDIKNSSVDLANYDSIVREVMSKENTFITTELIYKEIDECISWYLRETQMTFA